MEQFIRVFLMRTILIACMAVGAAALAVASPVNAQVSIRAPGVAIDAGQSPYWRENRDAEWRERREFRESEYRRNEWLRDHCVRDWSGHEYCRR
jgi:hypothetical protein